MITVGLDFGTHQTKVCIERKESAELEYTFLKFKDSAGQSQYTLPSIISIQPDGKLRYGYLPDDDNGKIIRYFKQATFNGTQTPALTHEDAMFYSILYLAYILFDLGELYGQNFVIQMGAPTDTGHLKQAKAMAVRILASAYGLVEELFDGNKQEFLDTPLDDLRYVTEIRPYSDHDKDTFGILVFPEAYACLNPLISQGKVSSGMSVMFDIGGGTTDVSFFTIEDNLPQVYDFFSINKGLNDLTDSNPEDNFRKDSNASSADLKDYLIGNYQNVVNQRFNDLYQRIIKNFKHNTSLNVEKLKQVLWNRPIIFCGGGSTFARLRRGYAGFTELHLVSEKEWDTRSVTEMVDISVRELCPILSTAYGLAISRANDNIKMKPFNDLFDHMRDDEEDTTHPMSRAYKGRSNFGRDIGGVSYEDYDSYK